MKRSVMAALLSGLVFPGLGHFVLRRPARGCLFLVPMAFVVAYLVQRALALAAIVAADVKTGALPLDPYAIAERIQAGGADPSLTVASWIALICWIGSVADALWLGRDESPTPPKETL